MEITEHKLTRKEIIENTLNDLFQSNWKSTFGESVVSKVVDAIGEDRTDDFWRWIYCGQWGKVEEHYFEGDSGLTELYKTVVKNSNEGGFEMPSWGTKGT